MESLLHSTGAVPGNRTRILELATRDSALEPAPHVTTFPSRPRESHPPSPRYQRGAPLSGPGRQVQRREMRRRPALPLSYGPVSGTGGSRTHDCVVPAAFAAEPPSGVAPDPHPLQEGAPALGRRQGRAAGDSGASRLSYYESFTLSIAPTKWLEPSSPFAKSETISNTASEKPPTFSTSSRSATCVEPYG
jgi:hypothetical protein